MQFRTCSRRMLSLGLCVLAVFGGTSSAEASDSGRTSQRDEDLIQGTWAVVSLEANGRKAPEHPFAKVQIVFAADTITFRNNNQDTIRIEYKLDSSKTPKEIDTTHEIDPGKPILQPGIYKLNGNQLTLFIEGAGQERPKSFATREGGSGTLFVLKRVQ